MKIQDKPATTKGPAETFTGDVWIDGVAGDEFCGQTLYVTEGVGLVQARGAPVIEIRPGDVIYTPLGEEHWHGAAPTHYMTHVALWEVDDQGVSAIWGAHVTDDEYRAKPSNGR